MRLLCSAPPACSSWYACCCAWAHLQAQPAVCCFAAGATRELVRLQSEDSFLAPPRGAKPLPTTVSRRTVATVGCFSTSCVPPPPFCRMQVFAFIRQEVARSTSATPPKSRTSPSQDGSPSVPGGESPKEDQADGAGAELLEKREVILSELPRLMELNKVSMSAQGGWGRTDRSIHHMRLPPPPFFGSGCV